MWEAIGQVLTSGNAWQTLIFLAFVSVFSIFLVRSGTVAVRTKHIRIGKADKEREIIRRQVEAAHGFIMGISGKIPPTTKYGGYFAKYILERVYDKVIEWVMFNHISDAPMYVKEKQESICNLVYTFGIGDEYKTPEFKRRMCDWTAELIAHLVRTREIYSKE